jgi:hypothetical protein
MGADDQSCLRWRPEPGVIREDGNMERSVAILSRTYVIGERLQAYDVTNLVFETDDGMEEFAPSLQEYYREAFADIDREPDICPLEMSLRWEEGGICCPHGPARIIVRRDLCTRCQRALEETGAVPVEVEVVDFRPDTPPDGRYAGYCHEGIAFVVRQRATS